MPNSPTAAGRLYRGDLSRLGVWACALCLAATVACKSESEFAAGSSNGAGKGKLVQACGADGATSTRLTTLELVNGKQGNYVAYELALTDCDGGPLVIDNADIFFDIDGVYEQKGFSLDYTIGSGAAAVSGTMLKVVGEDLFGKTGDRFFYYKTPKKISLSLDEQPVIMRFDCGGRTFEPFVNGVATPDAPVINTYLRIGNAASVENPVNLK